MWEKKYKSLTSENATFISATIMKKSIAEYLNSNQATQIAAKNIDPNVLGKGSGNGKEDVIKPLTSVSAALPKSQKEQPKGSGLSVPVQPQVPVAQDNNAPCLTCKPPIQLLLAPEKPVEPGLKEIGVSMGLNLPGLFDPASRYSPSTMPMWSRQLNFIGNKISLNVSKRAVGMRAANYEINQVMNQIDSDDNKNQSAGNDLLKAEITGQNADTVTLDIKGSYNLVSTPVNDHNKMEWKALAEKFSSDGKISEDSIIPAGFSPEINTTYSNETKQIVKFPSLVGKEIFKVDHKTGKTEKIDMHKVEELASNKDYNIDIKPNMGEIEMPPNGTKASVKSNDKGSAVETLGLSRLNFSNIWGGGSSNIVLSGKDGEINRREIITGKNEKGEWAKIIQDTAYEGKAMFIGEDSLIGKMDNNSVSASRFMNGSQVTYKTAMLNNSKLEYKVVEHLDTAKLNATSQIVHAVIKDGDLNESKLKEAASKAGLNENTDK